MASKKSISLFFILTVIPLLLAYIILRYRSLIFPYLERTALMLRLEVRVLVPFLILILFTLSIIFGGLLIRSSVRALFDIVYGEKREGGELGKSRGEEQVIAEGG